MREEQAELADTDPASVGEEEKQGLAEGAGSGAPAVGPQAVGDPRVQGRGVGGAELRGVGVPGQERCNRLNSPQSTTKAVAPTMPNWMNSRIQANSRPLREARAEVGVPRGPLRPDGGRRVPARTTGPAAGVRGRPRCLSELRAPASSVSLEPRLSGEPGDGSARLLRRSVLCVLPTAYRGCVSFPHPGAGGWRALKPTPPQRGGVAGVCETRIAPARRFGPVSGVCDPAGAARVSHESQSSQARASAVSHREQSS